jgi:TonB family protein
MVTRHSTNHTQAKTNSNNLANHPQHDNPNAQRMALAGKLTNAARELANNASGATAIETVGGGDGSPAALNYAALVKDIYENAWDLPQGTSSDDAITKARITIASDGSVVAARIVRPSGDAQVDRSVQRTLDSVSSIAPFPEGSRDKQRTYILNFSLKAKKGLA